MRLGLFTAAAHLRLPRLAPQLARHGTVGAAMEPPPAAKRARPDPLGDEMKAYEAATCDASVGTSSPCVVRLDGHCFSTYTRGFERPYDLRIHRAMVSTATDLLERFGAATAYTESDEISLLFAPSVEGGAESALPFSGRVQKIVSVFAGYASARFNLHMMREDFDASVPKQAALRTRVEASEAHFDARVFEVPSAERLCEYMRWRAVLDCRRNSISMLAQAHFPHTALQGVDSRSCVAMLSAQKGVEWAHTPAFFRHGTYVKREEWHKPAYNPKTGQHVVATRTRPSARSFELPPADEAQAFLLTRLWPETGAACEDAGASEAAG